MQQSVSWGYDLLTESKKLKKPPVLMRFLILKPCHTGVYFLLILICSNFRKSAEVAFSGSLWVVTPL